MITSINQTAFPNTLIAILGPDQGEQSSEQKQNVVRIFNQDNQTIGFNFFQIDSVLDLTNATNGRIKLTSAQINKLNEYLISVGFKAELPTVEKKTLVYGYVKTSEPHPDSDHLHVTTVDVGDETDYQIVCGAPNIAAGQKVVVALPETMMPDGAIIWPGALRGVESYGMITSARELGLKHAPDKRGILVLPNDFPVGHEFEPEKVDRLLAKGAI
ncbi:phenylalanyl-tRNA synthetase [Amylolactobacillus amylotrophicus DSM 20534]|uniref:Phenylalanyl-tRNA synthetase n=3 Tax=Amylolactobacillus TaxID=2767876 RepID=A0A0R1YH95_9LACO|nr:MULTISPECIES: DUF4479 and tRNA-binding domain-containing protein [Amylolactobacillus]APT17999.1 tRNA-binding protein [Amylolactobacillus amylophilus DSM 20533 = JCM 1125]KRK37283.1 phenylalanyl-tRNA synthetase [Amylolactobacillus amylotrophicus DSM 20534]KRM41682.1 phenylalanyl-tRNA synthetase [Amylolactobacillus amylophilus DSM 20533 = JCM 1125]GED80720.1 hypothetical protein LAM01_11930 [Amylolactobacillus amylophilus]